MIKIALYMRLSVDDEFMVESKSIVSQKILLNEYVREKQLNDYLIEEYIDDGYSGTNTNRPAFQRMIEDIKSGVIKVIVVKDFSRFSRDYILMGDYIENIFPFMGVRFISINDNYDSDREVGNGSNLDIQFKTLMNDFYAKDTSEKVKTVLNAKKEKGIYINWYPPYGYIKKGPDIFLDEKTCGTVKDIFDMYLSGMSTREIARFLNERGDIIPSTRKKELTNMTYFNNMVDKSKIPIWMHSTVTKILSNEFYTGTYCYNMKTKDLATNKIIYIPKDKWKRFYNHHDPIISYETFNKRFEIGKKKAFKKYKISNLRPSISHYFYCSKCGHKLERIKNHRKDRGKTYIYNTCRTCRMKDSISVNVNERIIIEQIENELKEKFNFEIKEDVKKKSRKLSREVEIKTFIKEKDQLFYKYKQNKINRDEYKSLKVELDEKIKFLENASKDEELFNNEVEFLSKEFLEKYIDRIEVSEDKSFTIKYKNN